jgi:hypothetical protein
VEAPQITNGHLKTWSRCPVSFKRMVRAATKYGISGAARKLKVKPHNVAYAIGRAAAKDGISKMPALSKKPSKAHAKARREAQRRPVRGIPALPPSGHGARSPAAVRDALTYLGQARSRAERGVSLGHRGAGALLGLICLALEALGDE